MPWFITAVIAQETLKAREEKHGIRNEPRSRTFGFYDTYNEAYKACEENRGSMEECLYDYLIMEYIETGIHPMVHAKLWWQWDLNNHKWLPMFDREPTEYIGITNWALG